MSYEVNGTLTVSDDVLADLAGYAAKECYGVVGMSAQAPSSVQEGLAGLLPSQRLRRGVTVGHGEDGHLTLGLHVVLESGVNISVVSQNLVDSVQYMLKGIAQIDDAEVVVHVEGMKVHES